MHWDDGPHGSYNSAAYKAQLEETARKPGKVARNDGDADQALGVGGKNRLRGILHPASGACDDGAAERHGARRRRQMRGLGAGAEPGRAPRTSWSRSSGSSREDVTVNVTLLGGGFGRKSKCDFVLEAALLVARDGRRPGQGHLDARGRPA